MDLDLSPAVLQRLGALYAERSAQIIRSMTVRPELRSPLGDHPAATAAEVVHVIKEEMAIHLPDIIVRRLGLGATGHPGKDVLAACASIAAGELGWSDEQKADEIAAVEEIYRVP